MFLFRRLNKSSTIIPVLISLFLLFLISKYLTKNDRSTRKDFRNRNSERIIGSEKHRLTSQFDLIKIDDHSLSFYVHFDLKGAAPKISYFEKLFPLLHKWGVTGICMEYEDMFPFDGIVDSVKHKQAYTKNDIEKINQLANENQLDVMPLLQTYGNRIIHRNLRTGHLEFVLKLKEFSDLRENPKYPQVITPCINRTYTVLFSMIDQYLNLHPNLRFFHIGHDEVYYFLTNPACDDLKRMTGIKSHLDLFGYHLNIIANYIKKKSPDLILLIWHDVIQNLDLILLQKYNLINLINPVLWSYREDMSVEGFVLGSQADIFGQYQSLWGATAFKGATHEIATISDVKHYYENQVSWIKQLHSYIPTKWKNFDGMILTGWSRYDHFLSLCELLPYSIPSMLFSIAAWQEQFSSLPNINVYPNRLHDYVQKELECSSSLHLTIQDHLLKPIPKCKFPGADVYELIISLSRLWGQVQEVELFVNKYVTDLHVKYDYIHTKRGEECLEKLAPIVTLLNKFLSSFTQSMNEIFPEQVAIEWLETYFMKRYRAINERYEFIQRAVNKQKSWLPRPIPNIEKLEINR